MKLGKSFFFVIIGLILLINPTSTLLTRRMVKNKFQRSNDDPQLKSGDSAPVVETSCNVLDFSKTYNYSGIVASGYLRVNKNNSALAYTFYGKKGVTSRSQLRNYPTILWLNGGPGSSSQIGNLQEIGPLTLTREFSVVVKQNNYTWANNYNLLFIDQPVGTGLSYADTTSSNTFAKSMDGNILYIKRLLMIFTLLFVSFIWKRDALVQLISLFLLQAHYLSLVKAMVESTPQLLLFKF